MWASLGIGAGTQKYAGALLVSVLHGQRLFSIRTTLTMGELFEGDDFWDLAALYGGTWRDSGKLVALSGGLGVMGGDRNCSFLGGCTTLPVHPAVAFSARYAWPALSFLGASVYAFANLNSEQVFAGVVGSIDIGSLR